jgi:hypothetical protein
MKKYILVVILLLPLIAISQEKIISSEQMVLKYKNSLNSIAAIDQKISLIENRISTLNPQDSASYITITSANQRIEDLKNEKNLASNVLLSTEDFLFINLDSPKRPLIVLTNEDVQNFPEHIQKIIESNPLKFKIEQN